MVRVHNLIVMSLIQSSTIAVHSSPFLNCRADAFMCFSLVKYKGRYTGRGRRGLSIDANYRFRLLKSPWFLPSY